MTTKLLHGHFDDPDERLLAEFEARPDKSAPWQGPRRKAPPIRVGERFTPADVQRHRNGVPLGVSRKPSRRMLRKLHMKANSRTERSFAKARNVRLESERLATNNHEAKRYVIAEANARRIDKEKWLAFLTIWKSIGASFATLLNFARAK